MSDPPVDYLAQLRSAVAAAEVTSPHGFTWLGREHDVTHPSRTRLAQQLTGHLYRWFYATGGIAQPERDPVDTDRLAFHRACQRTLAERCPGQTFRSGAGYLALEHGLGRPRLPNEMHRVYVDVSADDAAMLAGRLATDLDAARISFMIKFFDDPDHYDRCDTCVVYARTIDRELVLSTVHAALIGLDPLRPSIPAFTEMIKAGIGAAADPVGGGSFGAVRCAAIADGLIRAYDHRATVLDERIQIVADRLAERGVSITEPYLPDFW